MSDAPELGRTAPERDPLEWVISPSQQSARDAETEISVSVFVVFFFPCSKEEPVGRFCLCPYTKPGYPVISERYLQGKLGFCNTSQGRENAQGLGSLGKRVSQETFLSFFFFFLYSLDQVKI